MLAAARSSLSLRYVYRSETQSIIYLQQVINYNHLFPTRYALDLEGLKSTVSNDTFKEVSQREEAKKAIKKLYEERYHSGKNRWFFTPLRF